MITAFSEELRNTYLTTVVEQVIYLKIRLSQVAHHWNQFSSHTFTLYFLHNYWNPSQYNGSPLSFHAESYYVKLKPVVTSLQTVFTAVRDIAHTNGFGFRNLVFMLKLILQITHKSGRVHSSLITFSSFACRRFITRSLCLKSWLAVAFGSTGCSLNDLKLIKTLP